MAASDAAPHVFSKVSTRENVSPLDRGVDFLIQLFVEFRLQSPQRLRSCDVLHPAAERAGVPWVSFHTFPHTCASLLFAAGKNVKQVQAWLGHADPGFTVRTYIHLMDEGVGDADFLDDIVGGGRTIEGSDDG